MNLCPLREAWPELCNQPNVSNHVSRECNGGAPGPYDRCTTRNKPPVFQKDIGKINDTADKHDQSAFSQAWLNWDKHQKNLVKDYKQKAYKYNGGGSCDEYIDHMQSCPNCTNKMAVSPITSGNMIPSNVDGIDRPAPQVGTNVAAWSTMMPTDPHDIILYVLVLIVGLLLIERIYRK